jgi:hypothetical protein
MYRPRELPANRQFTDDAGGAVDTSRGSSGKANAVAFAAVQPQLLRGPQSRLKRIRSRRTGARGRGGLTGSTSL